MWNGSKFALFRLQAKIFLKRNGLTLFETIADLNECVKIEKVEYDTKNANIKWLHKF